MIRGILLQNVKFKLGPIRHFKRPSPLPHTLDPRPLARAKVFANVGIGTLVSCIIIWISTIKQDKESFILPLVEPYFFTVPDYILHYYLSITLPALPY